MTDHDARREEFRISYLTSVARTFQRDNIVGWMSSEGNIYQTELWYHCQFFIENDSALPEAHAFLKPYWDEFQEPRLDVHRASGRQWHEYIEIPMTVEEEVANQVRQIAYAAGWGRIGTYGGDKIELECFDGNSRLLRRYVREFAQLVGRELTLNVVAPSEQDDAAISRVSAPGI